MITGLPLGADGIINSYGLPDSVVDILMKRVEDGHGTATPADKWRLLQAEVLSFIYYLSRYPTRSHTAAKVGGEGVRCQKCGAANKSGGLFCEECGATIGDPGEISWPPSPDQRE